MGPDRAAVEDLARVGTWELDLDQGTVRCSEQMLRLHGITALSNLTPISAFLHCIHPEDQQFLAEAFRRAADGAHIPELEYRVVHADGAVRYLVVRAEALGPSGTRRRLGGVAVDITEHRDREGALHDSLLLAQAAAAELRSVDEQKNLFLRAVSHDLRTPLTIMQGFAAILVTQDDRLEPEVRRDYAQRIEQAALRLQQLTDLLDLDRLSRGVLEPDRQPVDLRRLATEVVEALDLAGRVSVHGDPIVCLVDPAQVERILENLVANAVRHTPARCRIEVRSEVVDDGVLVTVDDDGPGIPEELREEIFNVFRKVHPMSSGTGVGLPLVRRFAELHGGRAWVEGRPGGGATFRVFLPTAPARLKPGPPGVFLEDVRPDAPEEDRSQAVR